MKTEKCLADLQLEVIYNDKCIRCGACGAFCPNITFEGGNMAFKEQCSETVGVCYNFCPRSELDLHGLDQRLFGKDREDFALGVYEKAAQATLAGKPGKSSPKDVTTALLLAAMDAGIIDSAVLGNAAIDKALEPVTCTTKDEIMANGGERKGLGPLVWGVGAAIKAGNQHVAVVGRPCHAQAIAKIKGPDFGVKQERIALVIAQFCLAQGKGCTTCIDYSGEFADISIDPKTGDLLIRSALGQQVVDAAVKAKAIKLGETNIATIQDAATKKKTKNFQKVLAKASGRIEVDYLKLDDNNTRFFLKSE